MGTGSWGYYTTYRFTRDGRNDNLEIRDGVVTQMCELILIETATGKAHHLPLTEATTVDQLRTAVEQRAIPKPYEARLSCHPHERAWD